MNMNTLYKKSAALAVGGVLLVMGAVVTWTSQASELGAAKVRNVGLSVDDRPLTREKQTTSFAPVVKKVAPSVVKVFTTTKAKASAMRGGPFEDPFFRQFFGNQFGGQGIPEANMPPQHGIGSGVIVTKDGYILTNNHVVDEADELKVALQDGREFTAKVVGKDPKTDIAVIKIKAENLPQIEITDSDKIEVGDLVLAVGNPYGIGQTVTMGMVSAKGRAPLGLDYEDFIQTDAAINPGNSGGALVDADGRLIGINTAIYSRSGGNQGIGFAVPVNLARNVMDSLIKTGKVTRGYLGVSIQDINPALAKEFNLKNDKGALVADVVPNGPADKAGLKSGDVIVQFNGKPVADSRHLKLEVANVQPGETADLNLLRDGATKTVEVAVKDVPGTEKLAANEPSDSTDSGTLQGVAVQDLDAKAREQLQIPAHVRGAVVTSVAPSSAASEAGLKAGDVITSINRQPVKSAEDAVKLTESPKDKTTLLRVWSHGANHYVVVDESQAG